MWLGGCSSPGPEAHDGYSASVKRYGFEQPRASSPMPSRSTLGNAIADSRLRRGAHNEPFQAFDQAMEENRWMSTELNEAPQWTRPWQVETHRLRQEIYSLQTAEHRAELRAQLHEQQASAEARSIEHQTTIHASKHFLNVEQQAALHVRQAVQAESHRALEVERRYAERLAATEAQAAAAMANANACRAEGPRLEAQAAAHAQRMINVKLLEADRRTSEAAAARECCERLVLRQFSEMQDYAVVNGKLASDVDQIKLRMHNTEEVNTRLSHRLCTAEEANQAFVNRLHEREEAIHHLIARLRAADPALAAQLTGTAADPEAPQRTAVELEAENLELRANLLEVTEQLEELSERHQEVQACLREKSKSPPRGASPRSDARQGPSRFGGGTMSPHSSTRMQSSRTAGSSGGLAGSARSGVSSSGGLVVGSDRRGNRS